MDYEVYVVIQTLLNYTAKKAVYMSMKEVAGYVLTEVEQLRLKALNTTRSKVEEQF